MTQKIICLTFLSLIIIAIQAYAPKSSGSHPSSTGAPGEETCAKSGCHSATTDSGDGINFDTFRDALGSNVTEYIPGETYSLSVKIIKSGITKYGFQIVGIDAGMNNAGFWSITDAVRTWHQTSSDPFSLQRKYVTHTTNGNVPTATGEADWTFDWIAPAVGTGTVNFYYCVNATNNNGDNSGDALFLSSYSITEGVGTGTGIFNYYEEKQPEVSVHYSEMQRQLVVDYKLQKAADIMARVTDITGKHVESTTSRKVGSGSQSDILQLESGVTSGIYIVSIFVNNQIFNEKVLIP